MQVLGYCARQFPGMHFCQDIFVNLTQKTLLICTYIMKLQTKFIRPQQQTDMKNSVLHERQNVKEKTVTNKRIS